MAKKAAVAKAGWEFTVEPSVGAIPVKFGMTPKEVSAVLGPKESQMKGDPSEYRFSNKIRVGYTTDGVQDLSFCPDKSITVIFQGVDLLNDKERFNVLVKADEEPVERLGFLVFPKIGIAVTGFHDGKKSQRALTIYAEGSFNVSKFKPYDTAKLLKLSS